MFLSVGKGPIDAIPGRVRDPLRTTAGTDQRTDVNADSSYSFNVVLDIRIVSSA